MGHVHLKVADLDRAERFWSDVLGFTVRQRYGSQALFLAADGYHHHVGLNTWESAGGSPPAPGTTGIFHVAFLYPSRAALAAVVRSVIAHGWPIDGAADHGVSEAVYLRDPDGNGIELAVDRTGDVWPVDVDGNLAMFTRPLDLAALLAEAPRCRSCPI
ncbi:MAG: VOC family protein [Armatimonadota bacterium]